MTRRFFNLLAGASLLLCLATAWLWMKSMGSFEQYYWASWRNNSQETCTSVGAVALEGRLLFRLEKDTYSGNATAAVFRRTVRDGFYHRSLDIPHWGFDPLGENDEQWAMGKTSRSGTSISLIEYRVLMPAWAMCVLTAALPTIWRIGRLKAMRRHRNGFCSTCGYDLRATPDRCPECGAGPARGK